MWYGSGMSYSPSPAPLEQSLYYSVEATDLGWLPNEWPLRVSWCGRVYARTERVVSEFGELLGYRYDSEPDSVLPPAVLAVVNN